MQHHAFSITAGTHVTQNGQSGRGSTEYIRRPHISVIECVAVSQRRHKRKSDKATISNDHSDTYVSECTIEMPTSDYSVPNGEQSVEANYCLSYNAILVELKDTVILTSLEDAELPKYTMKSIVYCAATREYQCGRSTQEQYFDRLACDFNLPRQEVEASMLGVRRSMRINRALVEELEAIKTESKNLVRLFAVANLSHEDYAHAASLGLDWTLFDQTLLSSDLGMQKPELRFYRTVLSRIGLAAEKAVLVDSDPDNVLAALSLGLQHASNFHDAISLRVENLTGSNVCHEDTSCEQRTRRDSALLDQNGKKRYEHSPTEAVLKGTEFLQDNAKTFCSYSSTGVRIEDNFAELLILELTGDQSVQL
jgi:FMN phosphatase YigB (HAD superfamily)